MEQTAKKRKLFIGELFLFLVVLLLGLFIFADETVVVASRPLLRQLEQGLISFNVRQYESIETEHFTIRYSNTSEEILRLVAETAEEKFEELNPIFEYEPDDKILLILYSDGEALMKNTFLDKDLPPMGVYYGNALHILDPRQWVSNEEDLSSLFKSQGPLLHELVHLFVDHMAAGNFPMWFTEGVSLYFEYYLDGYEWGSEVLLTDREYTAEAIEEAFQNLDQYTAYTIAFRMVHAYVEKEGLEGLMSLIDGLGQGKTFEMEAQAVNLTSVVQGQ